VLCARVELKYIWCIAILVGFESLVTVLLKWNMMLGHLTVRSWHLEGMWCVQIQGHVVEVTDSMTAHRATRCHILEQLSPYCSTAVLCTVSLFVDLNSS
jgi:hypothetical protein